jgi:hypothetical protein
MGIFKDDGSSFSVSTKEIMKTIEELFAEGQYAEMFQKAGFKNSNSKNKKEALSSFYQLMENATITKMVKDNTIDDFFTALSSFLDNRSFTDSEKTNFFNGCQNILIKVALNAARFDILKKINVYRETKDITPFCKYIAGKAEKTNLEAIEQLLDISTGVTRNNSEILRIIFNSGVRNYDFLSKLIKKYNWDINGVGTTLEEQYKTSFTHMLARTDGTMGTQIFYKFIKDVNNTINFDIETINEYKSKLNLFEVIFGSNLNKVERLDRIHAILEYCNISVKHIGYLNDILINKIEYYSEYYDHKVYDALFAHESFNSDFFDREAILNKIVKNDTHKAIIGLRGNNNTVNPTNIMLTKMFKYSKPAAFMNKHPFITWIEGQNENFCKDTLRSLVNHYGDDLLNLELRNIRVDYHVRNAFEELGFIYPKNPSWKVMWSRDNEKKKMRLIRIGQDQIKEETIIEEKQENIKPVINNFSITLIEQVKDVDIKKLIESVHFNYQQYHTLGRNRMMDDNVHYMTELLPKFLKTTIDNYLHFSMLDADYAKEEALVQLKLLNRKAFSILKDELEQEQKDMEYRNAVHKKVIDKY